MALGTNIYSYVLCSIAGEHLVVSQLVQLLCAPIFYDVISTKFSYSFEEELDPDDNQVCGPIFFFLAFILPMTDDKNTGRYIILE